MKKILAVAVAAAIMAPLAASADTTLYGRLDNSLSRSTGDAASIDFTTGVVTSAPIAMDKEWDVRTETTRIGVKGSEDLGNGMKAIFQAEWSFDSDAGGATAGGLANRLAYVGLSAGWGTVAIGRQWTPYYGAVNKTDIHNTGFNTPSLSTSRTGNAIAYVSPDFSGFGFKIAGVVAGESTAKSFADAVNASVSYDNGPLSLGAGYHKGYGVSPMASDTRYGLAAKYNFGMFSLIGQVEQAKLPGADDGTGVLTLTETEKWTTFNLGAEATFGNNVIRGTVGQTDAFSQEETSWAIGAQHNFSKQTRVYAEYGNDKGLTRDAGANVIGIGDTKTFSLGLRHDF